jgi:hypothetical protein
MRAALVLVLVATGCYRPDARAGAPCAAGDRCPSGLSCRGGLCLAPGDDPLDATDDGAATSGVTWRGHASGSFNEATQSAVATSSDISGEAGDLYLAVVSIKPSYPVTGIAGLGATWTRIREQCGGRDTARLAMFWTVAATATTGTVTATLNNGTPFLGSAVLSVHRYSGADLTAPIGSASWANTNGHDGDPACAGGTDSTSYAWSTLDTQDPGSIVFVGTHTARYTHTPGAGFVEREDLKSGDTAVTAGLAVEEQPIALPTSDILVSGTYSNAPDWSVIAVELRGRQQGI